jgi:hypothetical protein
MQMLGSVEQNIHVISAPHRHEWPSISPIRRLLSPKMENAHALCRAVCRRKDHMTRHWLDYTVIGVASLCVGRYVYSKQQSGELSEMAALAYSNVKLFFQEHVAIPGRAIYEEVRALFAHACMPVVLLLLLVHALECCLAGTCPILHAYPFVK